MEATWSVSKQGGSQDIFNMAAPMQTFCGVTWHLTTFLGLSWGHHGVKLSNKFRYHGIVVLQCFVTERYQMH